MQGPSLFVRTVLALCLMVGFYVLALGIAVTLLALPVLEIVYLHRIHLQLLISCLIAGVLILYSILPRPDRFEAPGPQLTHDEQPRLFELVSAVAGDTRQAMPSEIYLVPDANAWVAQRGGFMAMGSRRIMGLGLPLLQTLDTGQLRAVLAHEFGHYHGGDTRLGPWIYKTRGAIVRTVQQLAANRSIVHLPFLWYGKLFLGITQAISRRQELAADALAARVAGARALGSGLQAVHAAGMAHQAYWINEVVPVLNSGYRPPLADGFQRFLGAHNVHDQVTRSLQQELTEGRADPYDSHPSLRERLAALGSPPEETRHDPAAISLLDDVGGIELQLLEVLGGPSSSRKLQALDWNTVGTRVYLPQWREFTGRHAEVLHGVVPESLPCNVQSLPDLAKRLAQRESVNRPVDEPLALARGFLGCALALAFADRGWSVSALPGEDISMVRGDQRVAPFERIAALEAGKIPAQDWEALCADWGIAGLDFEALLRPAVPA